jgi:hypothetical protein
MIPAEASASLRSSKAWRVSRRARRGGLGLLAVPLALALQARAPDRVGHALDLHADLAQARVHLVARDADDRARLVEHRAHLRVQRGALRRRLGAPLRGRELVPRGAADALLRLRDRALLHPVAADDRVVHREVVAGHALGEHAPLAVQDRAAHRRQQRAVVEPAARRRAVRTPVDDGDAEEARGHRAHDDDHGDRHGDHPPLEGVAAACIRRWRALAGHRPS